MRVVSRLLLAASLLAAPKVHAQQVAYAATVSAGTELDSATRAGLAADFSRARTRGIPVEPLVTKVREGRVKRANGTQIRMAVAALAARMDSARAALGAQSTDEEIIAGADALHAKATMASLRALRSASTRPIVVALGTLAQLTASGVAPQRAVEMIVALLRKNASATLVVALGNQVESDVASGLQPDEAAIFRLRAIEGSIGFGDKVELTQAASQPGVVPVPPKPTAPKPVRRP